MLAVMGSAVDHEFKAPAEAIPAASGSSRLRRFVEVALPVAVFAIVAPFAVNGLAAAVNKTVPSSRSTAAALVGRMTVAPALEDVASVVSPATQTPAAATPAAATPAAETPTAVSIDGLAADADDRTISLATEIIAGAPSIAATPTAATPTTPTAATSGDPTVAQSHSHGATTPEVALTRDERADLAGQLRVARTTSERFPTVAAAEAGGYTLITGYLPLIGAHYIKWDLMDASFAPAEPEMLLYDGTAPESTIVGLSYYLFDDVEPSPFVGGNDHWHQHIGLCIKDGVVVGGEDTTPADCASRGGAKAGVTNGWMVHAWVVPGWDSPQGVFSPEHPGLTVDLPTS